MMQLHDQCKPFFLALRIVDPETIDKGDVPEWSVPFQRLFKNLRRQGYQAGLLAVFAKVYVGQVPLNAEIGIVHPIGAAQPERDFFQLLAEQRYHVEPAAQIGDEGAERQWVGQAAGIKQINAADVHRGGV